MIKILQIEESRDLQNVDCELGLRMTFIVGYNGNLKTVF